MNEEKGLPRKFVLRNRNVRKLKDYFLKNRAFIVYTLRKMLIKKIFLDSTVYGLSSKYLLIQRNMCFGK